MNTQFALTIIGVAIISIALHRLLLHWLGINLAGPRQKLIATFTLLGGIYFFLEFLLPETLPVKGGFVFGQYHQQIILGIRLIGGLAFGLGVINLLRVHGEILIKNKKGWPNSLALLVLLLTVFGIFLVDFIKQEQKYRELKSLSAIAAFIPEIEKRVSQGSHDPVSQFGYVNQALENILERSSKGQGFFTDLNTDNSQPISVKHQSMLQHFRDELKEAINASKALQATYSQKTYSADNLPKSDNLKQLLNSIQEAARKLSEQNYNQLRVKRFATFVFQGLFVPLGSAMFSLLAFYVATAAYRTFRARSIEAAVMMITAVLVMLGQIPHGPLYISEDLPAFRNWIMDNISTPAFRAIFFGSSVAAFAMAIRMWFSLDVSPLSASGDSEE